MGFFDKYVEVDKQLMEDGSEVDFGDGFFVTVRHVSAKKVEMARSQKLQQLKVNNRNRALTPEQNKELTSHVVANAGIVSWRGGDAPVFDPDTAEKIFDAKPEFLEDIMTVMTTYEAFRKEMVEDAAGNSSQSSSGESNSENTLSLSSSKPAEASE